MSSTSNKLEPFLLMAKSARGAAATKLIASATAAPGVFVFAELLDLPSIQELRSNPQHAPHLALLELFSYGTYDEYKFNQSSLPPLNPAQITKLKHLSIVTLASHSRILKYNDLLATLDVSSIRALEDLIIDAMYQEVVRGRLDQKSQQFEVEYTMGRDLKPGQLQGLLGALKDWSFRTASVLQALEAKMHEIDEHEAKTKRQLADHEVQRQTNVSELIAASKNSDNRRGQGGQGGSFIPSQGPGPSDGRGGTRGQSQSEEMDWEGAGGGGAAYPASASRRKPVGPSHSGHASNTRKRNRDK